MATSSRIQDELKQNRPFPSKAAEATVALLRTADLVRRTLARLIEPYGITPQQYNVLRILRGAGDDALPTLEIGERLIEEAPGITRLLDRLEAKGLIKRIRCTEDRRRVLCRIAPSGLQLLADLDEPVAAADASPLQGLEAEQITTLLGILDTIRRRAT